MTIGHNSAAIDQRTWAWEVARSEAHAYVKLIAHTLRAALKRGQDVVTLSDERLAALCSLSVKTIRKYRKEAVDQGWVDYRHGDGRGKVSEYKMAVPQQTLTELSALLDAIKGSPQKVAPAGVSSEEKVTTAGGAFEERSPSQRDLIEPEGGNGGATFATDLKEKSPHTPLKENNIHTSTSEKDAARGLLDEEVEGLNGATVLMRTKIAKWLSPYQPDYRTAQGWMTSSVQIYGSDALKEAFAVMETKMASGDVVGAPLKLFAKIAQEKRRELDERAQQKTDAASLKGLHAGARKRIEDDRKRLKQQGVGILWE